MLEHLKTDLLIQQHPIIEDNDEDLSSLNTPLKLEDTRLDRDFLVESVFSDIRFEESRRSTVYRDSGGLTREQRLQLEILKWKESEKFTHSENMVLRNRIKSYRKENEDLNEKVGSLNLENMDYNYELDYIKTKLTEINDTHKQDLLKWQKKLEKSSEGYEGALLKKGKESLDKVGSLRKEVEYLQNRND